MLLYVIFAKERDDEHVYTYINAHTHAMLPWLCVVGVYGMAGAASSRTRGVFTRCRDAMATWSAMDARREAGFGLAC